MSAPKRPVVCACCERTHAVNADGTVRKHKSRVSNGICPGSGSDATGHSPAPIYPKTK